MSLTKNTSYESALFGLWLNWVIAGGVLFIPNLVSVYAPPQLIPIITYALAGALFIYNKSSLRSRKAVCPLLPTIAMRTLFMSATIMVIISIIYRRGLITYFYDQNTINSAKPFVTSLIISPVVFVNTLWERSTAHATHVLSPSGPAPNVDFSANCSYRRAVTNASSF